MPIIPDNTVPEQLRNGDDAPFAVLYKNCFPQVAAYINTHHGNTADAEDVFQEAVIVLLLKVRDEKFVLTASLSTYLFAIAKNHWLKRLRDNRLVPVKDIDTYQAEAGMFAVELQTEAAREEQLGSWLTKITLHCQRILKAIFFIKEPMGSLMQRMGWKNKHTAANQQYKCIQQVARQKNKDREAE